MGKTFWSVDYAVWGSDFLHVKWFDNKDAAFEFASQDYHDRPVAHHFRSAKSIKEAEEAVKEKCIDTKIVYFWNLIT